ncbi:hypothetical protein K449DRAFT_465542 [Hypoxylon sp. EC38]|nr:hypothetical protein K449DRAFT_465542 [Hypoxylon sp. EC38]
MAVDQALDDNPSHNELELGVLQQDGAVYPVPLGLAVVGWLDNGPPGTNPTQPPSRLWPGARAAGRGQRDEEQLDAVVLITQVSVTLPPAPVRRGASKGKERWEGVAAEEGNECDLRDMLGEGEQYTLNSISLQRASPMVMGTAIAHVASGDSHSTKGSRGSLSNPQPKVWMRRLCFLPSVASLNPIAKSDTDGQRRRVGHAEFTKIEDCDPLEGTGAAAPAKNLNVKYPPPKTHQDEGLHSSSLLFPENGRSSRFDLDVVYHPCHCHLTLSISSRRPRSPSGSDHFTRINHVFQEHITVLKGSMFPT